MKDSADKKTIDGFQRGPGRPAKYNSAAERQKAYRARKQETTIDYDRLTEITKRNIRDNLKKADEANTENNKYRWRDQAVGAWLLWVEVTANHDNNHDKKIIEAMLGYDD